MGILKKLPSAHPSQHPPSLWYPALSAGTASRPVPSLARSLACPRGLWGTTSHCCSLLPPGGPQGRRTDRTWVQMELALEARVAWRGRGRGVALLRSIGPQGVQDQELSYLGPLYSPRGLTAPPSTYLPRASLFPLPSGRKAPSERCSFFLCSWHPTPSVRKQDRRFQKPMHTQPLGLLSPEVIYSEKSWTPSPACCGKFRIRPTGSAEVLELEPDKLERGDLDLLGSFSDSMTLPVKEGWGKSVIFSLIFQS